MTPFITWVESVEGREKVDYLVTNAAVLEVTSMNQVITHTRWAIELNESQVETRSKNFSEVLQLIDNNKCYTLHLLKQGTRFRHRVWEELLAIPFASTITYAQLAKRMNSGARAVAGACRDNPYPGIIPCHRVVSSQGIGGFMGESSGACVGLKQRLLNFESLRDGI